MPRRTWKRSYKWFRPGLGVKRWVLLLVVGVILIGGGFGALLCQMASLSTIAESLRLDFFPIWIIILLPIVLGVGLVVVGLGGLNRTLLSPFTHGDGEIVEELYRYRRRGRGPKVVAIGGGHGLSALLRGLKSYTANTTAIVTVADDGGSSGRLRRALGVLPPGDFRNCIAALADDEALTTQLFQYRFPSVDDEAGLGGHSFGNLFITAMMEVTGSFERAILESSRVLAVQGRVVPSTLESVTLLGDLRAEPATVSRVAGESRITQTHGAIERVYLEPSDPPAYPGAVRAILEADLIVAGPGSLYTSVLPNMLVREIAQAIEASRATRVYVCNVATERGETDGYSVGDHMAALERHVGKGLFQVVLANDNFEGIDPLPSGVEPVRLDIPSNATYALHTVNLVDADHPWRHDSERLAHVLMQLIEET
jgi:uncharacterized cofD-like protein